MTASSVFGSKGLTIQPVRPAALPEAFISALDSVVSIRIGVRAYCGSARRLRVSVSPSMLGMFWSVSTRATSSCLLARSSASTPSTASTTV